MCEAPAYLISASRFGKRLTLSIWRAEDVALRRHHHVVEVLSEHRSREEGDGAQCFLADIDEVVFYRRWNRKNTARTDPAAIFHVQFPATSDDVLRFFGSVGVPAEAMPGFNSYTIVEDAVVPWPP
jgi:hypothetical protein